MMRRIAIFAALRWECQPVLRQLRHVSKRRLETFTVWQGRADTVEVWLIKTGMGMQRAAEAARAVVDSGQFDLFVSTGCAGALAPELRPGDLVLATTVIDRATDHRYESDATTRADWQTVANRAALHAALAPELCATEILASVADKRAAAAETGAVAVDMEGAGIAACATDSGIPFALVRAILDTAADDVEASFAFINPATGDIKPLAVAARLARHPGTVTRLLTMQRQMKAADASLTRFFAAWLPTPPR